MLGPYSTRQAHGLGGPQWDCPTTSGDGEAEAAAFSRQGSTLPGGGLPPQPASASCRARDDLAPRGNMLQLQVWLYDESPSHRFCFRVRGSELALPSGSLGIHLVGPGVPSAPQVFSRDHPTAAGTYPHYVCPNCSSCPEFHLIPEGPSRNKVTREHKVVLLLFLVITV